MAGLPLAKASAVTVRRAELKDGQISMLPASAWAVRAAIENDGAVLSMKRKAPILTRF